MQEQGIHVPALLDEVGGGLQVWGELGLVYRPGCLVLAGRRQPHPKVVAAARPVQPVVPITCTITSLLDLSLSKRGMGGGGGGGGRGGGDKGSQHQLVLGN